MQRADKRLLAVGLALITLAVTRAATVPAPRDHPKLQPTGQVEAFQWMATHEQALRDLAMADYPADPWSQDDHFHGSERERANTFAASQRVRRQDVFQALDEGIRAGWSAPDAGTLRATVPPCRPRPMY